MKCGTLAILGRSNVGKSTLLNALVKQKVAIVAESPQTTRTRVMGVGHYPEAQLVVIDTPGVHTPHHQLNRHMVQSALGTLSEADIVYVMVDASKIAGPGDRFVIDRITSAAKARPFLGLFLLLNKVDLVKKSRVLPLIDQYRQLWDWTGIIPLSAKTGLNLDRLLHVTLACLSDEQQAAYDEHFITDQSMRRLAAEFIREQVLAFTRDELPYSIAVDIEQFEEEKGQARISGVIIVDKPSHKRMVIGKGGQVLKAIGTEARREMERELRLKIFLQLWVKVKEGWRDSQQFLVDLGY